MHEALGCGGREHWRLGPLELEQVRESWDKIKVGARARAMARFSVRVAVCTGFRYCDRKRAQLVRGNVVPFHVVSRVVSPPGVAFLLVQERKGTRGERTLGIAEAEIKTKLLVFRSGLMQM